MPGAGGHSEGHQDKGEGKKGRWVLTGPSFPSLSFCKSACPNHGQSSLHEVGGSVFLEVQSPPSALIPTRPPSSGRQPLLPAPHLVSTLHTDREPAFYLKHNLIVQIPCPSHSPGSASPSFFIPT